MPKRAKVQPVRKTITDPNGTTRATCCAECFDAALPAPCTPCAVNQGIKSPVTIPDVGAYVRKNRPL